MDLKAWAQQNIQFVGNSYTNNQAETNEFRNNSQPYIGRFHVQHDKLVYITKQQVSSAHFGVSKTGKIYQLLQ